MASQKFSHHLSSHFSLDILKAMFEDMLFIRRFEERCAQFYTSGKIRGFCHLCIGQEAVPVATQIARLPQDTVITTYRCHGHALACGADPGAVFLELLGLEGGSSKGKGGSMHIFSPEHGFYGGHGIVGSSTALGAGLALAHKYKKDGGVCLAFLGDGAANQGQFFESMNMAALWKLPVLFIVENNGYSMGTSVDRGCAGASLLWKRGEALGVPGETCVGDDVLILYDRIKNLLEQVRDSQSPALLEIKLQRFRGHSMSDPGTYRSKEDLEKAKQEQDPITKIREHLSGACQVDVSEIQEIEARVKTRVQDIVRRADEASLVPEDEVWRDILMA